MLGYEKDLMNAKIITLSKGFFVFFLFFNYELTSSVLID